MVESNFDLFDEFYEIGTDTIKFEVFIKKIETEIYHKKVLPRKLIDHTWQNILDLILDKDIFLNNNYNESNRLVKLYIDSHSKTVACNDWVYWHNIIEGVIQNFNFRTSKVKQLITIQDTSINISEKLYGKHLPDWSPPSAMAVKTASGSIYFLAKLDKEYEDLEDMAFNKISMLEEPLKF